MSGDQGYHFVTALLVFALVHGFLDGSFARDGFETFVGALAISVVVFHGARSVAKYKSKASTAFARRGGSNTFGSLQPGALYHADLTTVSG